MKKRIVVAALLMVMIMTMTAKAAEMVQLPEIPTQKNQVIITKAWTGMYKAYTFDGYQVTDGTITASEYEYYMYSPGDKEWTKGTTTGEMTLSAGASYQYDTTKFFLQENLVKVKNGRVKLSEITEIMTKLQEQLTVENAVKVGAVAAGAVVGLVFMYWGVDKAERMITKAYKKGKIKL